MSGKPLKIERVKGCVPDRFGGGGCPFLYTDEYDHQCTRGGSPDKLPYPRKEGDNPHPPDCPLINVNISVELEP